LLPTRKANIQKHKTELAIMNFTAEYWIQKLGLTAHVEGGAFAETYRSSLIIPQDVLPEAFSGARNASTAIYFLLQPGKFSAFHKILSDELWHFYTGVPVNIYEIRPDGKLSHHILGGNPEAGEVFQCLIPGGSWFASCVETSEGYGLTGCTVAPGFDFADFELADRNSLINQYPEHQDIITKLTR